MTLQVAVLGTGYWARYAHVPALRSLPGVELNACIGRTPESAARFAAEEGFVRAFASVDELLASGRRPDLIVVAGPDDIHAAATEAALRASIPVFCEKPLANEAATAAELARIATETGTPATVGYSFRYSPAVQALRGDLSSERLGIPWLLELFEYNSQFHPKSGKPMNWKGDPAHARAGALYEYGSHVVDIASWLAGPVHAVSTNLTSVLSGARLDDIATLQLRFARPAIGVLVSGWVLTGSIPGIRIRVHGSEGLGEAELSETIRGEQVYRRYSLDGAITKHLPLEALGEARSAYARRHLADFIAVVRGEKTRYPGTLPSLGDGAYVQRVLEAALEATASWVQIEPP
jgi:predicted dehydrogenase